MLVASYSACCNKHSISSVKKSLGDVVYAHLHIKRVTIKSDSWQLLSVIIFRFVMRTAYILRLKNWTSYTYSVVSLSAEHTKQLGFVTRVLKQAEKWDSRETHSPRCPWVRRYTCRPGMSHMQCHDTQQFNLPPQLSLHVELRIPLL